jgi:tetratricopeptide (TPR) repeat protein
VLGFFKVFAFSFSYVADHLQYLALPVVAATVAAGIFQLAARIPAQPRLAVVATGLLLVLGLGLTARGYSRHYLDDETLFRANIARNPQSWMGHHVLAHTVGEDPARRDEAIALYRAALRLKPDNPDSSAALAALLVQQPGHREEAITLFGEAVRLRPTFAEAHNGLANELIATPGRAAEAITHYETALRLRPRFGLARANLAVALAGIPGREEDALACFDTVLREMPGHAPAHYHLANLLARLGRWPEALPHYERALELAPNAAEIHYDFARGLAAQPNFQAQTLAHVEAAVRLDPGFVEAYNLLGVVHARVGETEAARAAWQRALELRPGFGPAQRNLSILDQNSGR